MPDIPIAGPSSDADYSTNTATIGFGGRVNENGAVATVTARADAVQTRIANFEGASNILVVVVDQNGNAVASAAGTSSQATGEIIDLPLSTPLDVTAGEQYFFVFYNDAPGEQVRYFVSRETGYSNTRSANGTISAPLTNVSLRGTPPNALWPETELTTGGEIFVRLANVGLLNRVNGDFAAGTQVDIQTDGIGPATSITVTHSTIAGSFNLTIDDVSTPDHALATLPDLIDPFEWGQDGLIVTVSDGTNLVQIEDVTLVAPAGWAFINLASVPDFNATDSFAELAANTNIPGTDTALFPGYVAQAGQQIQYTTNPALRVDDLSVIEVIPGQEVTGTFRVRYSDGVPRYIGSVFTIAEPDVLPDAFNFENVIEAGFNEVTTSESITPTGFNQEIPITVTNGEYSINNRPFTSAPGIIAPGDGVRVRVTSSGLINITVTATLDIGGVVGSFSVSTPVKLGPRVVLIDGEFRAGEEVSVRTAEIGTITSIALSSVDGANEPVSITSTDTDRVVFTIPEDNFWPWNRNTITLTLNSGGVLADQDQLTILPAVGFGVREYLGPTPNIETQDSFYRLLDEAAQIGDQVKYELSGDLAVNDSWVVSFTGNPAGRYLRYGPSGNDSAFRNYVFPWPRILGVNGGIRSGNQITIDTQDYSSHFSFVFASDNSNALFTTITIDSQTANSVTLTVPENTGAVPWDSDITLRVVDITARNATFGGLRLLPRSGWNYINWNGVVPDLGATISLYEDALNNQPITPEAGDQFQYEEIPGVVFSSDTTMDFTGTASGSYSVVDVSANTLYSNLNYVLSEAAAQFTFVDSPNVPAGTTQVSNVITVSGIAGQVPISVVGGEYSVNSGSFTASPGQVGNGDTVRVRGISPLTLGAVQDVVLTIGGVTDTFSIPTIDTVPAAFAFASQTNVAVNYYAISNTIVVSDINESSVISITGGTYSVNGGVFRNTPSAVINGDTIRVRIETPGTFSTTTTATLVIGGVSGQFSVETEASAMGPVFSGPVPFQSPVAGELFILDLNTFFNDPNNTEVFSIESGNLPAGVTMVAGLISGTPTTPGDYSAVVRVEGNEGDAPAFSNAISFQVAPGDVIMPVLRISNNQALNTIEDADSRAVTQSYANADFIYTNNGLRKVKPFTDVEVVNGVFEIELDQDANILPNDTGYIVLYDTNANSGYGYRTMVTGLTVEAA